MQHRVSPGAAKSLHGFLFVVQQQQQQQRQRQSMETEYIEHSHLHSRPKNKLSRTHIHTTNMILLMANGAFYNDCDRSFFIAFARFLVFSFLFLYGASLYTFLFLDFSFNYILSGRDR